MESGTKPRRMRAMGWVLVVVAGLSPVLGAAEDVYDDYGKLIQSGAVVRSPGSQLFGENINLYTGSMEIIQTDVELRGNNALQVRVGRRFMVGSPTKGHFKLWDLDIPYMHGVFGYPGGNMAPDGWAVTGIRDTAYNRCSRYSDPPAAENQGGTFDPSEFWRGSFLYRPGSGDQELLQATAQALRPGDGRAYPIVLKDGAAVRCLASLDGASEAGARGEGFELVDTQGNVYAFDHMVSRFYPGLRKSSPAPQANSAGTATTAVAGTATRTAGIGDIVPMMSNNYTLQRREVLIYPTRVTDRFGNSVTYNWNPAAPWQLSSIVASDGRRIDLSYAGGDGNLITSVTTSGRTWSYGYSDNSDSVTLPDGSRWTFDLLALSRARVTYGMPPGCDNIRPWSSSAVGSIVAPTGARSDYTVNSMLMGRSWVPRICRIQQGYSDIPYQFYVMAVTSRRISGPGLPAQGLTWSYDYGSPNNCWEPSTNPDPSEPAQYVECNAGSPISRDITVRDPAGQVTRYRFGNRYWSNEGLLLQQDFGWNGSSALRSKVSDYASSKAAPYAVRTMYPAGDYGDNTVAAMQRPVRQVTIIDNGDQFVWRVAADCNGQPCFDEFARPLRIERFSLWGSRTDETAYYDERVAWVLGQIAINRNVNTGLVTSQIDYGSNALPQTERRNGKVVATYAYNPDGTLAQIKDALGNATAFSAWKRGIAQSVRYADGTGKSANVDDNGWVRNSVDENNFGYAYAYDAMGRLSTTTYPVGDSVSWNPTLQLFEPVGSEEYGIGAGHWRQSVTTGNARKITYFDALWRPLLTREYDAANEVGTLRAKRYVYDHEGRVVFESYPSSSESASIGVWTEFDAVGRPTAISQDSEQGLLTTTTQYPPGLQTLVTNPRGAQTRTGYQAFDQPVYDAPSWMLLPESGWTHIMRDVFGKPIRIERGTQ